MLVRGDLDLYTVLLLANARLLCGDHAFILACLRAAVYHVDLDRVGQCQFLFTVWPLHTVQLFDIESS